MSAPDKKALTIGIAGLGLIGGSFFKAVKTKTKHRVFIADSDRQTVSAAAHSADGVLDKNSIPFCDIILIALYPRAAMDYLRENAPYFSANCIVIDCCGIKGCICDLGRELSREYGFGFIGGHPMAGREVSGYANSKEELFFGAYMILVPENGENGCVPPYIENFFLNLGFRGIQLSSSTRHDRIIACTSQLAHIVSSAYAKSPTAGDFRGFSAGSFRDMTRVATMNTKMWSELFIDNRVLLSEEIGYIIENLKNYKRALDEGNTEAVAKLIDEGNAIKASFDAQA